MKTFSMQGAVSRDPELGNLPGLSQYQRQAAALMGHFVGKVLSFGLMKISSCCWDKLAVDSEQNAPTICKGNFAIPFIYIIY